MNLLIPTNDGISIAPDLEHANKFRSLSVVNGSVEKDELKEFDGGIGNQVNIRSILNTNTRKAVIQTSEEKQINSELHYILIANNISKNTEKKLNENNFEVLLTSETNITNAIIYYLRYHAINESDYCCCP